MSIFNASNARSPTDFIRRNVNGTKQSSGHKDVYAKVGQETLRGQFMHIDKVSDISEDEWGEIQRYGRVLHKEQEDKEKNLRE